jgi:type I restriction enzyme S subunit
MIPKLRFPEFSGEWEERRLGEIGEAIIGLTYSPKDVDDNGVIVLRSSNVKDNLLDLGDIVRVNKKIPEKLKIKKNDIVICVRNGSQSLIGKSIIIKEPNNMTFGAFMSVFRSKNNKFVYYLFQTQKYKRQILQNLGARINQITNRQLLSFKFYFPPTLSEQEKIADFLSKVDEKIEITSKKIEKLKEYKKGLLQKLLNVKNGIPELRFPEFSGEWEKVKVRDLFDKITRGQVLSKKEISEVKTDIYKYPVYSSQTLNNGLLGYYKDYLYENAITWTTDGANAGNVRYRKGKFYCTNVSGVLISHKGYANQCIAEILNRVTKKYVSYVGNPKLMNNTMTEIKIFIPPTLKEQQKIAKFLSSIDEKIELNEKKLSKLKEYKKGLLQKMFV